MDITINDVYEYTKVVSNSLGNYAQQKGKQMDITTETFDAATTPLTPEQLEALLAVKPVAVTSDDQEETEESRVLN